MNHIGVKFDVFTWILYYVASGIGTCTCIISRS
jgi:hypothetical protein